MRISPANRRESQITVLIEPASDENSSNRQASHALGAQDLEKIEKSSSSGKTYSVKMNPDSRADQLLEKIDMSDDQSISSHMLVDLKQKLDK